jgi:hypothetical protein
VSRLRIARNWVLAPVAIVLVSSAIVGSASGADSLAGSQGTDTSLPATDSQVTVSGRGAFESLKITVNQTKNLTNQAVSITWEGGQPTIQGPGRFAGNFLQILQCWGDDDGSVPGNPGPPPEQCVQGASNGTYNGVSGAAFPSGNAVTRVISQSGWANFDEADGSFDPRTGLLWRPFRAVDGSVVNEQVDPDFNPVLPGGNYWLNSFFNIITTNEVPGAATSADGTGAELFQLETGVQASGLGCGQRTQTVNGQKQVPKCWIVVVPRGTPTVENAGTPLEDRADSFGVSTSPLAEAPWANRIAIPLEFNPVDSPCRLGVTERRIAGNELAAPAVASWQPALCAGGALPPFSYAPTGDGQARGFVANPTAGSPGMSIVQRPIDPTAVRPNNPVVYAPLTVSGLTIGFNVERIPRSPASPESLAIEGVRVAEINLTPRLVAKLLTQSYRRQLEIFVPPTYEWMQANPAQMGDDPDFVQFNPEFAQLSIFEGRSFSGLQLPTANSDAAEQLWKWVLSDPEAAAWLAGTPDEFGMKVNPYYSTTAAVNPTGNPFGNPAPNSFPKADPYCYQSEPLAATTPPPLCGTDWMPYARSFDETASRARRSFDGARIALNPFAQSPSTAWGRSNPQVLGRRAMLSLTDTSSASTYGLQTARLSRSGDNGPDRTFIAPDTKGLSAGLAAMVPGKVAGVVEPPTGPIDEAAYPLTTITYAAIAPLALDAQARSEYAAFLEYASGPGQVSGARLGQLPAGYVPLSPELVEQTAAAAQTVRTLQPVVAAPAPAPAPAPPSPAPATGSVTRGRTVTRSTASAPVAEPPAAIPTDTAAPAEEAVAVVETGEQVAVEESRAVVVTPSQGVGRVGRVAVPALGVMALASALLALELTKRPRRSLGPDAPIEEGP